MAWDRLKPEGNRPLREGDDAIRENNAAIEDALSRDHSFPGIEGVSAGEHNIITLVGRTDDPVQTPSKGKLFSKLTDALYELYYQNDIGGLTPLTGALRSLPGLLATVAELNTVADGDTAKNNHTHSGISRAFSGCCVYITSFINSIASGVSTALDFDGEVYDTDSIHGGDSVFLIMPSGATLARFSVHLILSTSSPVTSLSLSLDSSVYGEASYFLCNSDATSSNTKQTLVLTTEPRIVTPGAYYSLQFEATTSDSSPIIVVGSILGTPQTTFSVEVVG